MSDDSAILGQLAEEFTAQVRQGKLPSIEDYATRHPELAERIRALFPTLMLLEGLAGGAVPSAPDLGFTPGALPALAPGAELGPYLLGREIGRGGMGIVFEARHRALGRLVALKVLPVFGHQGGARLERFLREARTAAGLHHTNIVPVFDVGQVHGLPYYAMQLIHGLGLDRFHARPPAAPDDPDRTRDEPPHPAPAPTPGLYERVARIGVQVAEGLAYAHARRVIHRDIKPSNLLLDDQGTVWITDFGLARGPNDVTLTHTGQVLGTPRYMSPEQAAAATRPVDHRTDIYSLGATLYELLTRRPAFDGRTPEEVVGQILNREPVPPRRLDRGVPRDLETIILKAMARNPQDRYQRAQDLAEDLRHYLEGAPIRARRIGLAGRAVRWARRNPAVACLLLAVVLALLGGTVSSTLLALRARDQARMARLEQMRAEMHAQEALAQQARAAEQGAATRAQQERAQQMLYAAHIQLAQNAWREHDPGPAGVPMPPLWRHDTHSFSLSHDGRRVAVLGEHRRAGYRGHRLVVCDLGSGRELLSRDLPAWLGQDLRVALSPTGGSVAVLAHGGWPPEQEPLLAPPPPGSGAAGLATACRGWARLAPASSLQAFDVSTGRPTLSVALPEPLRGPVCYSPDGKHLLVGGGGLFLWDVPARRRVDVGKGVAEAAFGPGGLLALLRCGTGGKEGAVLEVWDLKTRKVIFTREDR